ncbi:MAG: hypothetical protein KGI25_05025, partial [Thaumarchaeota archaeon]|nr:hypothetical protein [Nitrososphaerota archaeon]
MGLSVCDSDNKNSESNLRLEKEVEDIRGKILFLSHGDKKINLVEIKKGFARGGHYHKIAQDHIIISGKLEYREENVKTGKEHIKTIAVPTIIHVPPDTAHLLIAIEDTLFLETFDKTLEATNYPKYRN